MHGLPRSKVNSSLQALRYLENEQVDNDSVVSTAEGTISERYS